MPGVARIDPISPPLRLGFPLLKANTLRLGDDVFTDDIRVNLARRGACPEGSVSGWQGRWHHFKAHERERLLFPGDIRRNHCEV